MYRGNHFLKRGNGRKEAIRQAAVVDTAATKLQSLFVLVWIGRAGRSILNGPSLYFTP